MATYYFVNGSGDWANTNNWSLTRGGASGAGPPTSGDTVYIESGTVNIYTSGSITGLTAVYCTAGYTGALGTSAAAAQIAGTTLLLQHSGGAYITGASWTTVKCSSPSSQVFIFNGAGTIATLNAGSTGNIVLGASQICTTCNAAGARISAEYNATGFTTFTTAGSVTSARNVATLNIKGGASATITGAGIAISTAASIENGATLNYMASGTIPQLTLYPGSMFQCSLNPYPVTVTNRTAWVGANYSTKSAAGDVSFISNNDVPV